jgi:hypothetical protein
VGPWCYRVDVVVLEAPAAFAVGALGAAELGDGAEVEGGAQLGGLAAAESI